MVGAQDNGFLWPGHLVGALAKWFLLSTPGLYPGQLFYSGLYPVLAPFTPGILENPILWLWEWGMELWEFQLCWNPVIPVISSSPGWDDGMLQHCLTLMECSSCTIEFRLQL